MSLIPSLLLILLAGPAPEPARDAAPLRNCRAVDGDTLRCGRERIRLLGIDAPEMPGHCQPGRRCMPGDPFASRASLARALEGRLTIERVGADRYGRTLGLVRGLPAICRAGSFAAATRATAPTGTMAALWRAGAARPVSGVAVFYERTVRGLLSSDLVALRTTHSD